MREGHHCLTQIVCLNNSSAIAAIRDLNVSIPNLAYLIFDKY